MKRWLIRCTQVAGLAMGALLVTGTAAQADWNSGPNAGLLNGNQTSVNVQVPINVCGNALALGGFASASCGGGSSADGSGQSAGAMSSGHRHRRHHGGNGSSNGGSSNGGSSNGGSANGAGGGNNWNTGPNAGLLNGNQTSVSVGVPITVCGNAIAVFGFASASC